MVTMNTIYIDFDNTIVESNKKIIELLNKEYGLSKTESDSLTFMIILSPQIF